MPRRPKPGLSGNRTSIAVLEVSRNTCELVDRRDVIHGAGATYYRAAALHVSRDSGVRGESFVRRLRRPPAAAGPAASLSVRGSV